MLHSCRQQQLGMQVLAAACSGRLLGCCLMFNLPAVC